MRSVLVAAALVSAAAWGTAASGPFLAPAAAQAAATRIELVDQTTWAQVDGTFDIRVRVTGAPAGATIQLLVHDQLSSRQAFADSLSGELDGQQAAPAPQPLVLDALRTTTLSYPIGEDGAGLGRDDHGVYPVSVIVADANGETLDQLVTYLVLQPDAAYQSAYPPLSVAVIMDVGAPPGLQPDGSIDVGTEELADIAQRIDVLNQASATPVSVAPVPETLDALAEGGRATRPTFDALVQAVQTREVLARPYVDLDLDALASAGMLTQVHPEADAGAQAIRARVGFDPVRGIWLTGPNASPTVATALHDLGITRAIVPSTAVTGVPDETDLAEAVTGPVALAEGGPLALVADGALAERLVGQEGRLDAQRFVAELAMIWALAPSHTRGVVVQVPSQPALDPEVMVEALGSLAEPQTVVRPVTVDQMFAVPPPGDGDSPLIVELSAGDGAASADLNGLAERLPQAQTEVSGLAAMLDDRRLIRSLHRSLWIAPGSETPNSERMAYVDRVDQTEAGLAAAINAPETFRITLTARSGTIPLSIDNTSNQSVRVRVHLTSSQIEFPDGNTVDLDVPPGGERVDLDVRLRASGAFPLGVRITSPDESIVLDRTTFTIRSTAVSGVGLVLSVGAGLFLLIWWARHWRTARRSTRLVQEHPAGPDPRDRAVAARRH